MRGFSEKLIKIMAGDENRFIIPVYQRNYDWTRPQCQQLYEDLLNVIEKHRATHFFGCIVRAQAPGGRANDYLIIDGQQRMTTVTLLLLAIVHNIKDGNVTPIDNKLENKIWYKFIVDEFQPEERKMRLKPIKDDQKAFDAIVYKSNADYIVESAITKNFKFFYDKIKNETAVTVEQIYDAVTKLEIIDIYLEPTTDDPQLIFESLNSTGLNLSEADKIRNYVLMGLDVKTQEQYYDDYWNKIEHNTTYNNVSSFIRDYLTLKTSVISSIGKVYFSFKDYVTTNKIDIKDVLTDMLYYSKIYYQILTAQNSKDEKDCILRRLNQLDMTVMDPYMFALLDYYNQENISHKELIDILKVIESFLFRRLICGIPTNALNKIFCTLHKEVLNKKRNTEFSYLDVMVYTLENKHGSSSFPNDEEFKNSLITKNIYKMRAKNSHYLFDRLENEDSKEFHDVLKEIDEGNLTIEHVMPQALTSTWKKELGNDYNRIYNELIDTIGNLTLTGYNSEYNNSPFTVKRDRKNGFKDSHLWLNQYISSCSKWTEDEIKERQRIISEKALKLWTYPTTRYVSPHDSENNLINMDDEYNYTFHDIISFNLMGAQETVDNWADAFVKIFKQLYDLDAAPLYKEIEKYNRTYMSSTQEGKTYQEIGDGLYLNTNSQTNAKISFLRHIFDMYNLDASELTFELKPEKDKEE